MSSAQAGSSTRRFIGAGAAGRDGQPVGVAVGVAAVAVRVGDRAEGPVVAVHQHVEVVGARIGDVDRAVPPPDRVGRRRRALGVRGDPAAGRDGSRDREQVGAAGLQRAGAGDAGARRSPAPPGHLVAAARRAMTRTVRAPELSVERRRVPRRRRSPGRCAAAGRSSGRCACGRVAAAAGVHVRVAGQVGAVDVEVEVVARRLPRVHRAVAPPGPVLGRREHSASATWLAPRAPLVGAGGLDQVAADLRSARRRSGHRRSVPASGHGLVGELGSRPQRRRRDGLRPRRVVSPPAGRAWAGSPGRVSGGWAASGSVRPDVADLAGPERRLARGRRPR